MTATATAPRRITQAKRVTAPLPFELSLILPDLEDADFTKVCDALLKIEYLGERGVAARQQLIPMLSPEWVIDRWTKVHHRRPGLPLNACLRTYMTSIPLQAGRSLRAIGVPGDRVARTIGLGFESSSADVRQATCNALIGLDEDALCMLRRVCDMLADTQIRMDAIATIGWIGPMAQAAVPKLEQIVLHGNREEREEALHTLMRIGALPRSCFPRAFEMLEQQSSLRNLWIELILGTAKKNRLEFDFVCNSLFLCWSNASKLLRENLAKLLDTLADLAVSYPALAREREQLANEVAFILIGEGERCVQEILSKTHDKLEHS